MCFFRSQTDTSTCAFASTLLIYMADSALHIKKLGRYDITRVIGKGAMGVVYEARDPNLNRVVAIKTVRVDSLSRDDAIDYELRFRTEAHSAARLQHPNIVSVYDADREGITQYLVMEYVKGEDLKHHLDAGHRYSLEQSVRMVRDLLLALEYAHQRKIIHRDIKPANMLIEPDGRLKLTDFGVARIQDSGEATRTQGGMVGTLKYMSPEQVEGRAVDASSDLFSAGIVLYQLLTDRRPFDGESYFSIVNQITSLQPPAPSSINAMLPPAMDAVVVRALAKNKAERFANAHDFIIALQAAARRADPTITPTANPYKSIEPHPSGAYERSGSSAGSLSTSSSGSIVTQELELVYWKDVKDSDDTVDLLGFLRRFPDGVYADLAKRRLKRMVDGGVATSASKESIALAFEGTIVAPPELRPSQDPSAVELNLEEFIDITLTPSSVKAAAPAPTAPTSFAPSEPSGQPSGAAMDAFEGTMVATKPQRPAMAVAQEELQKQALSTLDLDGTIVAATPFRPSAAVEHEAQLKTVALQLRAKEDAEAIDTEATQAIQLAQPSPATFMADDNQTTIILAPQKAPAVEHRETASADITQPLVAITASIAVNDSTDIAAVATVAQTPWHKKKWIWASVAATALVLGAWVASSFKASSVKSAPLATAPAASAASSTNVTASAAVAASPAPTISSPELASPSAAALTMTSSLVSTTAAVTSTASPAMTTTASNATPVAAATPRPAVSTPKQLRLQAQRLAAARALANGASSTAAHSTNHTSQPAPVDNSHDTNVSSAPAKQNNDNHPDKETTPAGPKEACSGKYLFAYGSCLYEQCAKPVFVNHPYCIELKDRQERSRQK
jgi:eukaryotic-like serine/threonine-protein kinase